MASAVKVPPLNVRLGATRFDPDDAPHIDASALVPGSPEARAVVAVCPAVVYRETPTAVLADAAACLECGACLAVASGGLRWTYPRGGTGVRFREG
ncbi:hypothetical protein [Miniimonas sp. S16]|uniref:hypothetical protein n=1 Tax=Miniimonas sp. S16 TaxID=2171623 RepID=UPI00131F3C13|nr:hypothetical protein [Miniimonas sp. S16]